MATSRFRTALGGKIIRGRIDFAAEAGPANVDIKPGFGGLAPEEYTVVGVPLGRGQDTVTIGVAANNEQYLIRVKERTFSVDSGGAATVTTIRDALLALFTAAILAELNLTAVANGVDAIDITSSVAGEVLDTSVDADTPANISISAQTAIGIIGTPLCTGKRSGQLEFRSTAAITNGADFAVIG